MLYNLRFSYIRLEVQLHLRYFWMLDKWLKRSIKLMEEVSKVEVIHQINGRCWKGGMRWTITMAHLLPSSKIIGVHNFIYENFILNQTNPWIII